MIVCFQLFQETLQPLWVIVNLQTLASHYLVVWYDLF